MRPELHTSQLQTKAAQWCFSVPQKRRDRGGRKASSCWGGEQSRSSQNRRTTLERTHHLCSFVELSLFNPQLGLLGNQLYTPLHPKLPPLHGWVPPPSCTNYWALSLSALPPLCFCTPVVTTMVRVPYVVFFCYLRGRKYAEEKNLLFKIFIFLRVEDVDALRVDT